MERKIAFCCLGERIAPRFDRPQTMLVVTIDGSGRITGRESHAVASLPRREICAMLVSLGVSALVCGGLVQECERILKGAGITILDNVIGSVDEAVESYLGGELKPGRIMD